MLDCWEPSTVTWSYAAHAAIVEVDPEIERVTIEKYAIAHACGVVVNPLLVEGQIAGGTAQGLGGILLEEIAYDPEGQLLTGSLADYMVPTAGDVPDIVRQYSGGRPGAGKHAARRNRRPCCEGPFPLLLGHTGRHGALLLASGKIG